MGGNSVVLSDVHHLCKLQSVADASLSMAPRAAMLARNRTKFERNTQTPCAQHTNRTCQPRRARRLGDWIMEYGKCSTPRFWHVCWHVYCQTPGKTPKSRVLCVELNQGEERRGTEAMYGAITAIGAHEAGCCWYVSMDMQWSWKGCRS